MHPWTATWKWFDRRELFLDGGADEKKAFGSIARIPSIILTVVKGGDHNKPRFLCGHILYHGPRVTYFIPRPTSIVLLAFTGTSYYCVVVTCAFYRVLPRYRSYPLTNIDRNLSRVGPSSNFDTTHDTGVCESSLFLDRGLTCTWFTYARAFEKRSRSRRTYVCHIAWNYINDWHFHVALVRDQNGYNS